MGATLPKGWTYFQSQPSPQGEPAHWYATPPYGAHVSVLHEKYGARNSSDSAWRLAHTVCAATWPKLCQEAAEQVALYEQLTEGER
ncbi:hypothetical protein ABZX40_17370 [Streptomyces sp. NPDC004610]|uniref:hypothetical protein n=1 Tax=unclassified Streptomyces TaxID=2593676 RepID=UPI0033AED139